MLDNSKKKSLSLLGIPLVSCIEWGTLPDCSISVLARLDTGSKTSSLHGIDLEEIVRDSVKMIRFKTNQCKGDPMVTCEAKFVRYARIKVASQDGKSERRPVVETIMSLGKSIYKIELNLTNREEMDYRMLVGREALRDRFLVLASEDCECLQGEPNS